MCWRRSPCSKLRTQLAASTPASSDAQRVRRILMGYNGPIRVFLAPCRGSWTCQSPHLLPGPPSRRASPRDVLCLETASTAQLSTSDYISGFITRFGGVAARLWAMATWYLLERTARQTQDPKQRAGLTLCCCRCPQLPPKSYGGLLDAFGTPEGARRSLCCVETVAAACWWSPGEVACCVFSWLGLCGMPAAAERSL